MALLRNTRVEGDLYVEGAIYVASGVKEESKSISIPTISEDSNIQEDYIVKFESSDAEMTSSVLKENSGDYISDTSFDTFILDGNNSDVSFGFESMDLDISVEEVKADDCELVLIYESRPKSGDYYMKMDDVTYSTAWSTECAGFYYKNLMKLKA